MSIQSRSSHQGTREWGSHSVYVWSEFDLFVYHYRCAMVFIHRRSYLLAFISLSPCVSSTRYHSTKSNENIPWKRLSEINAHCERHWYWHGFVEHVTLQTYNSYMKYIYIYHIKFIHMSSRLKYCLEMHITIDTRYLAAHFMRYWLQHANRSSTWVRQWTQRRHQLLALTAELGGIFYK